MSSGAPSHNVRNRVPGDFGSVHRLIGAYEPFISRRDRVVYEGKRGAVRTLEVRGRQWDSLLDGHARGAQRIGLFPTLKTGCCRWGCLDLDAHKPSTPDRHSDGVALLDFLDGLGVAAYMATSRRGRGVHVWVFFDGPGVRAPDLHGYLEALARELRLNGPVDVFPRSATGSGGAVLLPYFGGTLDMLDVDLKLVDRERLEANPVSVIPSSPIWPPRHWGFPYASTAKGATFRAQVVEARKAGLVFERAGVLQARRGMRNTIAGAIACDIVRRGGTIADFRAWDARNRPPLATDEPEQIEHWWRWAQKAQGRSRRRAAGSPARPEPACDFDQDLSAGPDDRPQKRESNG